MSGKILWSKDFGDMEIYHGHGEGSSPVLSGDILIVNWDHQQRSFLLALNKRTGRALWKVQRDEITSWSTPLVVNHNGTRQVIVSATGRTRGYRLKDGKVLWEVGGLSRNVVSSPVSADGYVYVGSSYTHQAMLGIDLSKARGQLKDGAGVVWRRFRNTPYVPSPVLYGDMLCYNRHLSGFFTCLRAKTGKKLWGPMKLPGIRRMFSSPVGASDRIYAVGKYGTTVVLKRSEGFEVLARNQLDDIFTASPAVVSDGLILRGERSLYYIAR
jgi:outer membrane protein assembly factor BamB